MEYFKHNTQKYLIESMHLSDMHDLCYRRLLDFYCITERAISDIDAMAKRIRMDVEIVNDVLVEFFVHTENGFIHPEIQDQIIAHHNRRIVNSNNAGLPNRRKKRTVSISQHFDMFWATWPASKRKVGRAECEKRWIKRSLDEVADKIIKHVEYLKNTEQWKTGFEPAPLTYINQSRWLDFAPEATRKFI